MIRHVKKDIEKKEIVKTTFPITKYFKLIDNNKENLMSLTNARRRDYDTVIVDSKAVDEVSSGQHSCDEVCKSSPKLKKPGSSWSSPIIVDSDSSPPSESIFNLSSCASNKFEPEPKNVVLGKHATIVSTGYGSDVEMMEEIGLKDVPVWLRSPHFTSSDSSDDDLLNPISFTYSPVKNASELKDCNSGICSDSTDFKEGVIVKDLTVDTSTCKILDHCCTCTSQTSQVHLPLEYEANPPYKRELELLIITSGLVPLSYSQVEITLFSISQTETFHILLTLNFLSPSMHLVECLNYLMMINSPLCMVTSQSLVELWKMFVEPEELLLNSESTHKVINYFQCLVSFHPPGQHEVVREQYFHFIQGIQSSLIPLIISKEKWKIELLSIIVSVLLTDYFYICQHSRQITPLFHCLLWRSNEHHFINSTIRQFIQFSLDVYSNDEGLIKGLQIEVITQLFFLIYVECENVASDISISLSSLPRPLSVFTALSSLVPMKLRDAVTTNIKFNKLITSNTHQSVKIYLMVNSIN